MECRFRDSKSAFLLLCAVLYCCLVLLPPRYFPLIDSDSAGYLEFSIYRTAYYPLFLRALTWLGLSLEQISVLQVLLFAGAVIILGAALLRIHTPRVLIVVFVVLLGANGYFSGFHRQIMTESLFFTILLVNSALFIDYFRTGRVALLALAGIGMGILVGLRPAGMVLLPLIPIAAWLKWHERNVPGWIFTAALIIPVSIGPALERVAYRAEHGDRRDSILFLALLGKAAMLIRPDTAFSGPHADTLRRLGTALYGAYGPVQDYLSHVPSWAAWPVMTANYEAVAQGNVINSELTEATKQTGLSVPSLCTELAQQIVSYNFSGYMKLTLTHYLGQWSVTGLTFPPAARAVNAYSDSYPNLPNVPLLENTTPHPPASLRSYLVYPAFIAAGSITFVMSIVLLAFILSPKRRDTERNQNLMLSCFFAGMAHAYTFLVSLINISTPRFIMAVYPQILLAGLFLLLALLRTRKKAATRPST